MIEVLNTFGFPVFIACVLLYDKLKTNGQLMNVVENNNQLLKRIIGESR